MKTTIRKNHIISSLSTKVSLSLLILLSLIQIPLIGQDTYDYSAYDNVLFICSGDSIVLEGKMISNPSVPSYPNYTWTPSSQTSCNHCFETVVAPTTTTVFQNSYTYHFNDMLCGTGTAGGATGPTGAAFYTSQTYLVVVEDCTEATIPSNLDNVVLQAPNINTSNQLNSKKFYWLKNLIDTEDCCQNTEVTEYINDEHSFVYIKAGDCEDVYDRLYLDGEIICNSEFIDCFKENNLQDFKEALVWSCKTGKTHLEGLTNKINIHLYPNPTVDVINIDIPFQTKENISIQITNNMGQILKSQDISKNTNTIQIKVDELPLGTYVASIIYENKIISKKFIHLN